jgi:hypothetical protein
MTKLEYKNLLIEKSAQNMFPCEENGNCLYRGPEGKRCVVGWLIPDNEYQKTFEGNTIDNLKYEFDYNPHKLVNELTYEELKSIQHYHDILVLKQEKWNHEDFVKFLAEKL